MIALLLISFFILIALRVPIAVALGLSCLLGLAREPMAPAAVVAQRLFVSIDSFPLMAVPLYMLAGYLMGAGGISRRIVEFAAALVGNLRGGLAHVNILASMIFGGISGSAVADTAGIGTILIPAMKDRGYSSAYTAAVTGVSSTIGIVIPPSIPMIIIGAMLGVSVGKLFLGGIIPGLAIGLALMVVAYVTADAGRVSNPSGLVTNPAIALAPESPTESSPATLSSMPADADADETLRTGERAGASDGSQAPSNGDSDGGGGDGGGGGGGSAENEPFSWRRLGVATARAAWALLMPLIVIGGIVTGVFTPTEAGAVAVVYAWLIATFVYRELRMRDVSDALRFTAEATGKVFFLIATAGLYSWLLTANGFSEVVGSTLISMTSSPGVMLMIMAALLLLVTTFMESIAAMILLLPVLFPVAEQVGIDPVHFGVIVVLSIGVGLVTPPVGLCLYVAADIARSDVGGATRAIIPFLTAMLALLLLFALVPSLVTIVPSLLMD